MSPSGFRNEFDCNTPARCWSPTPVTSRASGIVSATTAPHSSIANTAACSAPPPAKTLTAYARTPHYRTPAPCPDGFRVLSKG